MKYTKAIKLHKNWTLIKELGNNLWTVDGSFVWYLCYMTKGYYIEVEHWFKTDFGSIPRPLWFFFDKTKYVSYILHDWLYSKPYIEKKVSSVSYQWVMITRKQCDDILIEWMYLEWASRVEIFFVYLWVRLFWWLFFKK